MRDVEAARRRAPRVGRLALLGALAAIVGPITIAHAQAGTPEARVRITTEDPAQRDVFVRAAGGWDRWCTTPCDATLTPGAWSFALSAPSGSPVEVRDPPITVGRSDLVLAAHLDDAARFHGGGALLLAVAMPASFLAGGLTIGAVLLFPGFLVPFFIPAAVISLLFVVAGLVCGIQGITMLAAGATAHLTRADDLAVAP